MFNLVSQHSKLAFTATYLQYKLRIFEYNKIILINVYDDIIDLSKGLDAAKSNNSKKYIISHYWCFDHGFKL